MLGRQKWLAWVQSEHQKEEEKGLWATLNSMKMVCWRQTERFANCWSTGIFTLAQPSLGFTDDGPRERRERPVSGGSSVAERAFSMPGVRGEHAQTDWRPHRGKQISESNFKICGILHLWTHTNGKPRAERVFRPLYKWTQPATETNQHRSAQKEGGGCVKITSELVPEYIVDTVPQVFDYGLYGLTKTLAMFTLTQTIGI